MEQINQENSLFDLYIDETSKEHLRKIATWAVVIVVCAIVGYIISIIKLSQPRPQILESEGFGVTRTVERGNVVGTIILILIGLLVNYFLFQFANFIRKGVNGMSQTDLNTGFTNLKIYFIIVGILVIISLVLFSLVVLVGLNGQR
ncbi:MAG TPA: DUF5362 family protein [Chitinophagaceae bacterium]|jgi:hypothetical protein